MTAVGRPTGAFVAADVARKFDNLPRGNVHHVDVVVIAGPAPTEGQKLAVGRPGRVDKVALVGKIQIDGASAIGVHQVKLWNSRTVADECDGLSGLRIPNGRSAGAVGEGEALEAAAAGAYRVKLGIAGHRR